MFDPIKFARCLQILEREGLPESPPPTIAVGVVPGDLAVLSITISNGSTIVTVLS